MSEKFSLTYSGQRQDDIKRIRSKYLSEPERKQDKFDELKKLDDSVTKLADMVSIIHGVVFSLIFGLGLSICLTNEAMLIKGIIIGIIGMIGIGFAYPIYKAVLKKRRKKVAPQILELTEELLGE